MSATVDTSKFNRSLRLMEMVPGKAGPDVLNKSLAKVAIGARNAMGIVQRTKKASAQGIRDDLFREVTAVGSRGGSKSVPLIILLATRSLTRKGIKPGSPHHDKKGRKFGSSTNAKLWRALVKGEAKQILARRLRSRGYIVAGWLHALDSLRNQAPGSVGKSTAAGAEKFSNGEAMNSFAIAATSQRLVASLHNTAVGAGIVSPDTLIQAAVDSATADNAIYLRRKLGAEIDAAIAGRATSFRM